MDIFLGSGGTVMKTLYCSWLIGVHVLKQLWLWVTLQGRTVDNVCRPEGCLTLAEISKHSTYGLASIPVKGVAERRLTAQHKVASSAGYRTLIPELGQYYSQGVHHDILFSLTIGKKGFRYFGQLLLHL